MKHLVLSELFELRLGKLLYKLDLKIVDLIVDTHHRFYFFTVIY